MTLYKPVTGQKLSAQYMNQVAGSFGGSFMVGGHSKGGNLALTSAMELNIIKKFKIKKIYNNDGPGLRYEEVSNDNNN